MHTDTFRLTWSSAVRDAPAQRQPEAGASGQAAATPPAPRPPGGLRATPGPPRPHQKPAGGTVASQGFRGSPAGAPGREREDERASGQSWLRSQASGAGSGPRGSRRGREGCPPALRSEEKWAVSIGNSEKLGSARVSGSGTVVSARGGDPDRAQRGRSRESRHRRVIRRGRLIGSGCQGKGTVRGSRWGPGRSHPRGP